MLCVVHVRCTVKGTSISFALWISGERGLVDFVVLCCKRERKNYDTAFYLHVPPLLEPTDMVSKHYHIVYPINRYLTNNLSATLDKKQAIEKHLKTLCTLFTVYRLHYNYTTITCTLQLTQIFSCLRAFRAKIFASISFITSNIAETSTVHFAQYERYIVNVHFQNDVYVGSVRLVWSEIGIKHKSAVKIKRYCITLSRISEWVGRGG